MSPSRLVLGAAHSTLLVEDYEPAAPHGNQLQVRIRATSLNHLDWKRIKKNLFIPTFPHVLGMDIAGEIVNAGSSTFYHKGDRVLAPGVVGWSDGCSFQTHALISEPNLAKIPENINFEGAATIPFSLATAACSLFVSLGINYDKPLTEAIPILIWGATGSVGSFAVQLAKLSGFQPIVAVVSSSTKISQAAALGADVVADSQDPDLVSKIQAAAPGLHHILDTVVTSETVQTAIQCLAQQSGIIATAIAYAGLVPEAVTVAPVFSGSIFGKTLKGEEDKVGAQIGQWLWQQLPIWLQSGAIRPLDYEVIGDLASIPVGLRRLEEHNAPRKLVVVP